MTKDFCSHRGTTVLAVLFTLAIVQRIDGYPRPWPFYLSYADKQPLTKEPSHNIDVSSAVADVLRNAAATTAEIEAFYYLKAPQPPATYVDSRDVSRILKISQQKRTYRLEDINTDEDSDEAKHEEDEELDKEKDEEADEELDKEINGETEELDKGIDEEDEEERDTRVNDNNRKNTKNLETDINLYDTNRTGNNNDYDMLIDDALKDKVFLTPKELDSAMENGATNRPENIDNDFLIFEAIKNKVFLTPEQFQLAKENDEAQTKLSTNDDRIVLPDLAPTTYLDDLAHLPVPSCNGSTYCENLPYYPSDEFVKNALRINYIEPFSDPSTITQRMGNLEPDGSRSESLCYSQKKEITPGSGQDENKEWHYIINNEEYEQKIEIELCLNEGHSCSLIEPPAAGYTTFCKQKYIYRHLVTITQNGTATKPLRMPSSCCCYVKFSGNFASRMAGAQQENNHQSPKLRLLLPGHDN